MVTHQTVFVKVFQLRNNYSVYQAQTYRLSSANMVFVFIVCVSYCYLTTNFLLLRMYIPLGS